MKMLQIQFAIFLTVLQQGARSPSGGCNTPQILNTKYNAILRKDPTTKIYIADFGNFKQGFLSMKLIKRRVISGFRVYFFNNY